MRTHYKQRPVLEIVRGNGGLTILVIRGRPVETEAAVAALLGRLNDDFGRAVPTKHLMQVAAQRKPSLHALRQYVMAARKILAARKTGYTIAIVPEFGYVLCEIAK